MQRSEIRLDFLQYELKKPLALLFYSWIGSRVVIGLQVRQGPSQYVEDFLIWFVFRALQRAEVESPEQVYVSVF